MFFLQPDVEDWGGGADTKEGAHVIRASSPNTSNRFPLVFFLEPDVEDCGEGADTQGRGLCYPSFLPQPQRPLPPRVLP